MALLDAPGDLAQTPLAAVLLEALNLRASGALEVVHGGGTSRLWFRDGRPVGAQVSAGFRPLGLVLLQAGLIDVDALSRSLARMAETHRPQGEILVEMGVVSEDDVGRALAEQQAEYFRIIAALDAAPFAFDANIPVPEWTRGSRLSPVRTIVDALERPQAAALVASALQPVASGGVRLASAYAQMADAFRWNDGEGALVSRLSAVAPLEACLAPSPVPSERARAMIAALLLLGLALPASGSPRATGDTAAGLETDGRAEAEAGRAPAQARRSDPAEARARRQRLLQQAMRNMGVGPFAGRDAPAAAPAGKGKGAPAGPAPGATAAEAELRQALLAVAPRARERDLFARLGLAETSGREDAKRAFLQLARQFHPDRFTSPGLADLRDVVQEFFAAVNEAYTTLSDDCRRAEYLASRTGASQARSQAASVDAQKGEACLRTRDFARARGFLEAAVRADPRPEYQAALALACIADPQHRDRVRARSLLADASKGPPSDRVHYVAGLLARDDGDAGTAERSFRAALELNPGHADALRELRALQARRAEKRR